MPDDSYFSETHFDIFLPSMPMSFFKVFIAQTVYTVCPRMNYGVVPLTNLTNYLHYGTNGTKDFFSLRRCGPTGAMTSSFLWFLDHTQRRITVSRTPLDE